MSTQPTRSSSVTSRLRSTTSLPAPVLTVEEGLSVSEHPSCPGCEHHTHVQFDEDDIHVEEDGICNYCSLCDLEALSKAMLHQSFVPNLDYLISRPYVKSKFGTD